jgi:two-component system cell cycle sensor histidine kinase/response regulator CckA
MKHDFEVLLVDDDPVVRGIFARVLSLAGLAVVPVESGAAALELLEGGRRFDVIVSDFLMPGLDGIALMRGVRQLKLDVPVILITGSTSALRSLERAGLPCLPKPIDNGKLVEAVTLAAQQRQH